nr:MULTISPECIES: hypothetical protein [Pseudooceanicola]
MFAPLTSAGQTMLQMPQMADLGKLLSGDVQPGEWPHRAADLARSGGGPASPPHDRFEPFPSPLRHWLPHHRGRDKGLIRCCEMLPEGCCAIREQGNPAKGLGNPVADVAADGQASRTHQHGRDPDRNGYDKDITCKNAKNTLTAMASIDVPIAVMIVAPKKVDRGSSSVRVRVRSAM